MVINHRPSLTAILCGGAIALVSVTSCASSSVDVASLPASSHPKADFSQVEREEQLWLEIAERDLYPLDDEMLAYTSAMTDSALLDEDTATQSEVDEMAKRLEECRNAVVEYHEPEDTIQTNGMSYDELKSVLEKGKRYHLEGFITWFAGSMNSDRHITIRWHGSDSANESCNIVIPGRCYKTDVHPQNARQFVGSGTFEGYDDSKPCFTCTNRFDLIE